MCINCGTVFLIPQSSRQKICTQNCAYVGNRKIGNKYVTTQGYIAVKTFSKSATTDGYELEHRMVMEQHLGRQLTSDEQVHHINGNKQDNDIKNLVVLTNSEHQKHHHSTTRLNTKEAIEKRVKTRWG